MSSSSMSAPAATALRKAYSVFEGNSSSPPWWAMFSGARFWIHRFAAPAGEAESPIRTGTSAARPSRRMGGGTLPAALRPAVQRLARGLHVGMRLDPLDLPVHDPEDDGPRLRDLEAACDAAADETERAEHGIALLSQVVELVAHVLHEPLEAGHVAAGALVALVDVGLSGH